MALAQLKIPGIEERKRCPADSKGHKRPGRNLRAFELVLGKANEDVGGAVFSR